MLWTLQAIADATGGVLGAPVEAAGRPLGGVGGDTRSLRAGELFVALRAGRDGHEYLEAAVRAGAGGMLIESGRSVPAGSAAVVVPDTSVALLDLGRAARRRLGATVVGITGSVGKTSVKDLCAAAVGAGRRTVASPLSFNNELGVPLTLANAPEDCEVAVLEMGARGPGHVALLCEVARPSVGVVTSVAAAHIETFGGLEGVARAKGELVEALPASGTAVLNGDDVRVRAMVRRGPAAPLLYSAAAAGARGRSADVVAEKVALDDDLRPSFVARTPWGTVDVRLEARGVHQVGNALAALAVAGVAGLGMAEAAAALRRAALSPWRMEVLRTRSGGLVLNDAYNANPASMAAALQALAAVPARRRVAVVGVMAELGDRSRDEHLAMGRMAASLDIEVVAVGTSDYGPVPCAPDPSDPAVATAVGSVGPGTAVLVKGSRVAGLEQLAARLAAM